MTILQLMPYQVQGADFLANRDRAGLHDEKTCSRCRACKPATTEFFGRMAAKRDGLAPHCKGCAAAYDLARKPRSTDRRKGVVRYTLAERKKRYRAAHPERVAAAEAQRDKKYFTRYGRERYRNDPMHAMIVRLRERTRKALKGRKPETTRQLLGCTTEEFRVWLEAHFLPGMSWENRSEWELDHKRPLSKFDLSDPAQRAQACHYTNIQPLWRADNRRKGAKCL